MKTRQEIKQLGKMRFEAGRWGLVLGTLLVGLVVSVLSVPTVSIVGTMENHHIAIAFSGVSFLFALIQIAVIGPLTIGMNRMYINAIHYNMKADECASPFIYAVKGYLRKLGGSLWEMLWVFIWSLLFIIPGIIKAFSYALTSYILADCPNVRAQDALKLSKLLMKGYKWKLFVLYLSFIGWDILNILTLGILGIFFVTPYQNASVAVFYLEVRENALRNGIVTTGQLDGTEEIQ